MDQHDGLTGGMVLVVEIDGRGVFLTDIDGAHHTPLSVVMNPI